MRGIRDWPEDKCRDSASYVDRGGRRVGGVNGGCLLFRSTQRLADEIAQALQRDFEGFSRGGAGQDFFSDLFFRSRTWPISRRFNYQLHQLHLNGPCRPLSTGTLLGPALHPENENEWPVIVHFSASPKPSDSYDELWTSDCEPPVLRWRGQAEQ